jgi:anthranilate 1,2-dioxygenase small subunit
MNEMQLWFEIQRLHDRYAHVIDNDLLEQWPALFTEDCLYEIVPRENAEAGLPVGLVHCYGQAMLRDRVVSLRQANIYEAHTYRHLTSGLQLQPLEDGTVDAQSSYVVVQTRTDGESFVFQAGRYQDRLVRTPAGWRFAMRRAIYDTSRVQTLLATPI